MLDGFIRGIFEGYRTSDGYQQRQQEWKFNELEHYPMLFSSSYLNDLFNQAESKDEHEAILDYLYRFNYVTNDVESYKSLEKKIIDLYYESPKPSKAKLYSIKGGKSTWEKY